jgi:5-dehydro-2-deoxygluconokinase
VTDLEVITMGRVSVDLYPEQIGVPLAEVETFAKSLGGSATNVAVAASRLGHPSAVITKVGDDGFGPYVRKALEEFGVDARWVGTDPDLRTPIVFCEIYPPDNFPLLFYREPKAPDMNLTVEDLDLEAIAATPLFWMTGTGLSDEPSRTATLTALERRSEGTTVFDLDYRPMLWKTEGEASRVYRKALGHATVAVGNRDEVEVALGTGEPFEASAALLELGLELAIVKRGPEGVLARTAEGVAEAPPRGGGRERARGRRRLRGRPVPRAALRLGSRKSNPLRQRCRGHRRLASGVRRRHAHPRGGRGTLGEIRRCLRS